MKIHSPVSVLLAFGGEIYYYNSIGRTDITDMERRENNADISCAGWMDYSVYHFQHHLGHCTLCFGVPLAQVAQGQKIEFFSHDVPL